ncbi:hypothetical protein [Leifsonia sp. NPDC058230]|uniref:hypothetical protein n=1 Tax=Leifsonia sp. NPDC058230 TaxID=3346391 RepID=UPI0036D8653C
MGMSTRPASANQNAAQATGLERRSTEEDTLHYLGSPDPSCSSSCGDHLMIPVCASRKLLAAGWHAVGMLMDSCATAPPSGQSWCDDTTALVVLTSKWLGLVIVGAVVATVIVVVLITRRRGRKRY